MRGKGASSCGWGTSSLLQSQVRVAYSLPGTHICVPTPCQFRRATHSHHAYYPVTRSPLTRKYHIGCGLEHKQVTRNSSLWFGPQNHPHATSAQLAPTLPTLHIFVAYCSSSGFSATITKWFSAPSNSCDRVP